MTITHDWDLAPSPAPDLADLLGPQAWARLHPAIRARLAQHASGARVCHRGTMRLEASLAGRCFAWLALAIGGPLPRRTGDAVAAQVTVTPEADGPGQVWTRRYAWPDRAERIVSIKRCVAAGVLEVLGRGFAMRLHVRERDGALVFVGAGYEWRLGRLRLPWPVWASPGRCIVVHAEQGDGRFGFTLEVVHPWLGTTFRQHGTFSTDQVPARGVT